MNTSPVRAPTWSKKKKQFSEDSSVDAVPDHAKQQEEKRMK